jgi:archaellin
VFQEALGVVELRVGFAIVFGMGKRGEMGVGLLIIFIAMILVASISAGVLLTTVTSLQTKSLTVGQESLKDISTHLSLIQITGYNGTEGLLENVSIMSRIAAGSDAINLNDSLLTITLSNATARLEFENGVDLLVPANAQQYFSVQYDVQGSEHRVGYITRGEIATLYAVFPRNVSSDELVRISFIPKYGRPSIAEFRTPDLIYNLQTLLFP